MRTLRQLHLYLGCVFAPLILYFALSGIWQIFGFNDVPKGETAPLRSFLHELSKPHTHLTRPGGDIKTEESVLFTWFSALMGLGLVSTTVIGILLALKYTRRPLLVVVCLVSGALLPVALLIFKKVGATF